MNLTLGVDRANVESKPETMRSAFDFLGKQPKHLAKKSVTLSSEASHNTRTRHLATATNMPSKSLSDAAKRARRRARLALEAIPGLLTHLVVAHILRSEYFGDPADLARLPAVSRAMRDAMAGTGLRFREIQRFTQATRAPSFLPIAVISNDTESIALREAWNNLGTSAARRMLRVSDSESHYGGASDQA